MTKLLLAACLLYVLLDSTLSLSGSYGPSAGYNRMKAARKITNAATDSTQQPAATSGHYNSHLAISFSLILPLISFFIIAPNFFSGACTTVREAV
jgi:hypothetical protein